MTVRIPLGTGMPDTSGDVYPTTLNAELALTNAKYQEVMMMEYPTGTDIYTSVGFQIPQDYSSTPVLVICGILVSVDAFVFAFGALQNNVADSGAVDVAYETEDLASLSNPSAAGYVAEDYYEETITLTPAGAYAAGQYVMLRVFRDDDVDTTTMNFLLTGLYFQYTEA